MTRFPFSMPLWRLRTALLALLAAGAATATPLHAAPDLQGRNWLVIKHEPRDPLNAPLWAGDPAMRQRADRPDVGVLVFQPDAEAPAAVPGPWRAAQWLRGTQALPAAVRQALHDHGHDLREVEVSPPMVAPFRAVGDSGIGRPLRAGEAVPLTLSAWGNDACGGQGAQHPVAGTAVLIRRGGCPYVEKIQAAMRAGAQAVLFVNNELPLNRVAGDCSGCGAVILAALPREPGETLLAAVQRARAQGHALQITLTGARALASALRVGDDGRVGEVGFIPYPFNHLLPAPLDPFELLALEAEHLAHESRLRRSLAREEQHDGVRRLPVFTGELARDPAWSGHRVAVQVAVPEPLLSTPRLWWDLELQCQGPLKTQCPPWDYIVQMFVCQDPHAGRCEDEVGRWITPYWSGGRWVHEITPLLGRLRRAAARAPRDAEGRALLRFEFHSIQPYRVHAALRYAAPMDDAALRYAAPMDDAALRYAAPMGHTAPSPGPLAAEVALAAVPRVAPGEIAFDALPLPFAGGAMTDGRYAQRQPPAALRIPAGVERVHIAALLSGHGFADDAKCAEFCNTVHHFEVDGGRAHAVSQPQAGSERGCLEQVGSGVVPNQGGTWIYGRNGWCPGDAVALTVLDLSSDVAAARRAAGAAAGSLPAVELTLRYRATVDGKDHAPGPAKDGRPPDARLDVTSYLVLYGRPRPSSPP